MNTNRLDADLENLSIDGIDDGDVTADATQQPRFPAAQRANGADEDDTVQLSALEDASMDLMGMNFSSPFKIPASASGRGGKTQSVLVERQNALDVLQSTPQAKARSVSTSSASSSSSTTPGSAVRRSGLPRPVSMMPSASPTANGTMPFPRSKSSRVLSSTPSRPPPTNGGSALENRARRLDAQPSASPLSPAKAKPEVWTWIQALSNGTADVRTFRRLARLSAEFKVATVPPGHDQEEQGDETVLQPGPFSGASAGREGFQNEAWLDGGLFTALMDGLKRYLVGECGEMQTSAQVVVLRMVENQYPLFTATDKEAELLEIVLASISTLSSTSTPPAAAAGGSGGSSSIVARKAAVQGFETLLSSWAARCDPVLGFDALLTHSHSPSLAPSTAVTTALLRSGFTPLLLRLPTELVVEDFLPRISSLLTSSLTAPAAEVRLTATTMLTRLNHKMAQEEAGADSHSRIFGALGLDADVHDEGKRALLDVLMYYFSKKS